MSQQHNHAERSRLDITARLATAVSAAGLLGSIIGRLLGARGFSSSDSDTSALSNILFLVFVLGLLVAVVTGGAAWWSGRRDGRASGTTTGRVVLAYLVLAIVVAAVLNAT